MLILISLAGHSQSYLGVQFNNIHIGNNLGILYEQDFKKFQVGLGLSFLLNNNSDDANADVFKNHGYAHNFGERFGLNFNSLYKIYSYKENYSIYLGYRFNLSHSGIRSLAVIPEPAISNAVGQKLYLVEYVDFSAYYSLEHNLQAKFQVRLSDRIFLSQSFGTGIAVSYDLDDRLFGSLLPTRFFSGQGWEVCWFYSIGIKYKFKK